MDEDRNQPDDTDYGPKARVLLVVGVTERSTQTAFQTHAKDFL